MLVALGLCLTAIGSHGPGAIRAPGAHAVAYVTDSLSHGTIGDAWLSLEEAILLHNGQLGFQQLSLAEQAQVSLIPGTGNTTDVTWIDIDGTSTPVITVERDLSPILDTPFGLLIKGFNEAPILDFSGANITRGLLVPANSMVLEDLILSGGPYGADVVQTDVAGQSGLTLRNVRFENQTRFGLRITATTSSAIGRVIVEDCTFTNVPTAITNLETGASRTTIFEVRNVTVRGAASGLECVLGPGGTGRYTLDRLDVEASGSGLRISRPGGADRVAVVESTHVRVRAPECVAIATSPTGVTWVTLRMWDLRAAPGGHALVLGNLGDRVYGDVEDSSFEGGVEVRAGGGPAPLVSTNLRFRGGTVILGGSTTQNPSVSTSRFDQCTVQSVGGGAVALDGCCVVGGALTGTPQAPFLATGCHVSTATATTNVQRSNDLVLPQLGSMSIAPENVLVGGSVTLAVDLPAGLAGYFLLGLTDPAPVLAPQPLHVYTQPSLTLTMPGVYRAQQSFALPIPNQPWLAGLEFTAQVAVIPDPGMIAPWIQLPPGRRFVLR
ncbi:MAG: hypothetical protein HZB39_18140 [Planctomycetes bacterium]|nr:hypothetical protein [Planctomycetota bacterium]